MKRVRLVFFDLTGSVLLLAGLIGNAAGGLARGLAGGLALAAAAVLNALFQIAGLKSDYSLHIKHLSAGLAARDVPTSSFL